jgi:hypothetical protein
LKPAAEVFHQRVRWKDFRGAAELLVPERRQAFEDARKRQHDDRDLQIMDYDLEDARLAGRDRAVVVSKLSWSRLPSLTVNTDTVSSEFIWLGSAWFLARQDSGPFARELAAPYEPTPATPPEATPPGAAPASPSR